MHEPLAEVILQDKVTVTLNYLPFSKQITGGTKETPTVLSYRLHNRYFIPPD